MLSSQAIEDRSQVKQVGDGVRRERSAPAPIRPPRVMRGSWVEARDFAEATLEPVFVPCATYCDDRGWSLMNLFTGVLSGQGQVNFSVQYPGVVKAWHRHDRQTDFWLCVTGHLKVGVHREKDGASWRMVVGEKQAGVVVIPPPLWHGAMAVGAAPAGLLYYVTRAFDADQPDEHRRPHDSVPGFSWAVEHR